MHGYHAALNCFPLGCIGKPNVSRPSSVGGWFNDYTWVHYLAPYIEQDNWFNQFDFTKVAPDPSHYDARKVYVAVYACPSDAAAKNQFDDVYWSRWRYCYAANWGNTSTNQQKIRDGVAFGGAPFTFGTTKSIRDIRDGTTNTLLASEVIPGKGPDWEGSLGDCTVCRGGQGFETWLGPNSASNDYVDETCPSGGDVSGIRCEVKSASPDGLALLPDNLHHSARSQHPGVVNAAMCDGSVRSFNDDVDLATWRALSTIYGGESLDASRF